MAEIRGPVDLSNKLPLTQSPHKVPIFILNRETYKCMIYLDLCLGCHDREAESLDGLMVQTADPQNRMLVQHQLGLEW